MRAASMHARNNIRFSKSNPAIALGHAFRAKERPRKSYHEGIFEVKTRVVAHDNYALESLKINDLISHAHAVAVPLVFV